MDVSIPSTLTKGISEPVASEPYRQCDPRWGKEVVKKETLCRIGCGFFSILRVAEESGRKFESPAEALAFLKARGAFTSTDLLYWNVAAEALGLQADRKQRRTSISFVRDRVADGNQVMLQVQGSRSMHFVYVVGIVDDDIIIDDSRDGQRVSLRERYKNVVNGYVLWKPRAST
jgi:hypothetical protein